jgi:hypothetical protein
MKPSILVVMLDFLVCSLLFFVGGPENASPTPGKNRTAGPVQVHEAFAAPAMQALQEEWNRDYEQQQLLARLSAETAAKEELRANLAATTATLAARQRETEEKTQALTALAAAKSQVEQDRTRLAQNLSKVETQLVQLTSAHGELAKEKSALAVRAEQLGQTVANQATTIKTLAEDVRSSQARLERQVAETSDEQRALQDTIAGLAAALEAMRADLNTGEQEELTRTVAQVAKGQHELQSSVQELVKAGPGMAAGIETLQSGQSALREQTAALAKQVETIQARKPGPYKAVKAARLELRTSLAKRENSDAPVSRFSAVSYPPVVNVGGRSLIVVQSQKLGLEWWALTGSDTGGDLLELKYTANRNTEPAWSASLAGPLSVLKADPRVATIALPADAPGVTTLELAGGEAVFSDTRKLHVFKSNAAGLSFEVEVSPDLADGRYLLLKRPLRGVVAWLENPAYRAEAGDYVVTTDGKLVGIMLNREKCVILTAENLSNYASTIPLDDRRRFQQTVQRLPSLR